MDREALDVSHLSELLSRDWQLPETEFSALLQGSSTCEGWEVKHGNAVIPVTDTQWMSKTTWEMRPNTETKLVCATKSEPSSHGSYFWTDFPH